jgi:hypothetical protein
MVFINFRYVRSKGMNTKMQVCEVQQAMTSEGLGLQMGVCRKGMTWVVTLEDGEGEHVSSGEGPSLEEAIRQSFACIHEGPL